MSNRQSVPLSPNHFIDENGNPISNKILLRLPRKECTQVLSTMEFVRLRNHQIIYEPGEPIMSGYFVNTGLISVLVVQPKGKSIEVGLIGNEGFTALPVLVGYQTNPTRLITHGDGTAYRCDVGVLKKLVQRSPQLDLHLRRFGHQLAMQTAQIAACSVLHSVEERLVRWILMSQDRLLSDDLPLTQEFIAQLLGTRRASVTAAVGILEKAGSISCTRGNVRIVNRKSLEEAACECYGIVQRQMALWDAEA